MKLVIVESPTKAKTIKRFLPKEYVVESSFGHIRDLPKSATEIPAKVKAEKWARLGVNVEDNFAALYIIPKDKKQQVAKLKKLIADADELFLATDEDREGEAISWHLLEVLKPKVPVKRMVFHEITKEAITKALAEPRELDMHLVHAQETRRILDRLYGYEVSPILWRKVAPKLSAGRVQSAALQLIVDREKERMAFVHGAYWDVMADFTAKDITFPAKLAQLQGKRIATGKDFDATTGKLLAKLQDTVLVLDQTTAEQAIASWEQSDWQVTNVDQRPITLKPKAPFITSTLQQEAGSKLGWSARQTMQVAQKLYEKGFITYMRTDSVQLSQEAIAAAQKRIVEQFGKEYLPSEVRIHKSKSKNAQEAHEAIRPSGTDMLPASAIASQLERDEVKLYDFIWKRTLASQMSDAQLQQTTVKLEMSNPTADAPVFQAGGRVIQFPGFLAAYQFTNAEESDKEDDKDDVTLPELAVGDTAKHIASAAKDHVTKPPARFSEAALVKELEALGIGRPSTYASIIDTIQRRGYVFKEGNALIPRFVAFGVVTLLHDNFPNLVNTEYTAAMEEDLDDIAIGQKEALPYLKKFYFGEAKGNETIMGLKNMLHVDIDARATCTIPIGTDPEGHQMNVRVGRYGPFVERVLNAATDEIETASIPDDLPPDQLTPELALEFISKQAQGPQALGVDPATNLPVYALEGRYGPYVQLGDKPAPTKKLTPEEKEVEKQELARLKKEAKAKGEKYTKPKPFKPKMKGLLAGMKLEDVNLDVALQLLSFPKELGVYAVNGEPIIADLGRFGPYIRCGDETRSLSAEDNLLELDYDRAVLMLDTPKVKGRRAKVLRILGNHPSDNAPIQIYDGRYGPYIKYGTINVSLPNDIKPEDLTIEQAVELIKSKS